MLELVQSSGIHDVKVELIGLPDEFVEHGSQAVLRAKYDLDAEGIAKRILSSFSELSHPVKGAKE